jgi:hypothetical protein
MKMRRKAHRIAAVKKKCRISGGIIMFGDNSISQENRSFFSRLLKNDQGIIASLPSRSGGSGATKQSPSFPMGEIASLPSVARKDPC